MSDIIKKYSGLFLIIPALWAVAIALYGCTDDLLFETTDIPDAEVTIKGEVLYRPFVPTEVQTRADAPEGPAYKNIKSLYLFFFDAEEKLVKEYCGDVSFTQVPPGGSSHYRVTFEKKVHAGKYYIFAVANISPDQKDALTKVTTIEELKNFKLKWDDDIDNDLEMFGVFRQDYKEGDPAPDNETFEDKTLLTIIPQQNSIHSWLRRAVSKVTVDFDGANLKEGVTVYIKNAVLKDVASGALLGTDQSKAESVSETDSETSAADKFICRPSAYSISYGSGNDYKVWPTVTKTKKFSPSDIGWNESIKDFHSDDARALPCYENMQGDGPSKLQDSDGDGIIDSKNKDGVDNGTYLEVEGYYVSDRPEYKSEGKIIYRFMLGKDAVKNFDLVRNHHYKITMRFKDYGNDVDWHIEYAEKFLDVTYPHDVNYQGKFFVPSLDWNLRNAGHEFKKENEITVTSYIPTATGKDFIEPDNITFTYYTYNPKTKDWDPDSKGGWLKDSQGNPFPVDRLPEGELSEDKTNKKYTFVADQSVREPVKAFETNFVSNNSSKPYNLSGIDGGDAVVNTANCYMVNAPGWYCFPLVYGNAITGGETRAEAYASPIVNYLNEPITDPYIKNNKRKDDPTQTIDLSNVEAKLIWQDAEDLVSRTNISYDRTLFGGMGGIKFYIPAIKEGNAVIALIDKNASEDTYVNIDRSEEIGKVLYEVYNEKGSTSGSTKAVWSWHIWATRIGFGDNYEKDIRITNHDEKAFDVMPVNLGWCSGGDMYYHRRRKCDITFKFGDKEIVRTIIQYPHYLLPRGDNPYYQWGRKDPFVGTNTAWGNKPRWDGTGKYYGTGGENNPPRLYNEPKKYSDNVGRKPTKDCLDALIKNPDKWHNAPRVPKKPEEATYDPPYPSGFNSTNDAPLYLWATINGRKTVYDPCPAGYQVSEKEMFTGFTATGDNSSLSKEWYDVLEVNMPSDFYGNSINSQVLEFYTDPRKIQSIIFPVSGYRDYDSRAEVQTYNTNGYVWSNTANNGSGSFYLQFMRKNLEAGQDWQDRGKVTNADGSTSVNSGMVLPLDDFFNTDGCSVRPCRISSK